MMLKNLFLMTLLIVVVTVVVSLGGCSGERYARATDYDADGGAILPATVGGCKVATSEKKTVGKVTLMYEGPDGKCLVEYESE
ncbi:MAG: hypothetical protein AB2747_05360 [Candidatus Thiodiazotropha taylori]